MLNINYNRGLVKMLDQYGSVIKAKRKSVDVIIASQALLPPNTLENQKQNKGGLRSHGQTLVIDLRRPEEEIYADIHKHARYHINRATKRDDVIFHEIMTPSDEQLQEFVNFYNKFAKHRNLPKGNLKRLIGLKEKDSLIVSYVTNKDLQPLCYHVYFKSTDNEQNINLFKMEFGGEIIDVDKRIYSLSLIGKVVVFLFWMKMRRKPEYLRAKLSVM